MKPSNFNLTIELDNHKSVLINTLTGAMDILPNETIDYLQNGLCNTNNEAAEYLYQRQYLLDADLDEAQLVQNLYGELLKHQRRITPLRGVIILTFDCNLRCKYCWQQYKVDEKNKLKLTRDKVDNIFISMKHLYSSLENKSEQPPIIQLFGGEPLLPENKEIVGYILNKCSEKKWYAQITTNGVFLNDYMWIFEEFLANEIQVTIDGPYEVHDRRRIGSKYEELIDSISRLLQINKIHTKLRVNVDIANIDTLPELANDIIKRQWYTNRKFYAYITPLRDSSLEEPKLILERNHLLQKLMMLKEQYPQIEMFDMLGWNGYQAVRVLENTGKMPYPRVNICDTNMNQFVFTPNGEIHVCAEEAHEPAGIVGYYWPGYVLDENSFLGWYNRSPLQLSNCKECALLPVCGGGCQLFIKNRDFYGPYCQAVRDSLIGGIKNYIKQEGLV